MFERDFTLKKYRRLCNAIIESVYTPVRVRDYLLNGGENCIILRHDVDRNPESALRMAGLEKELGIRSTYYFRMVKGVFRPDVIKEIGDMGHEVGYHYEVLDKAKGDFKKAIELFEEELLDFRSLIDVKTICMHGNPLKPWSNKDIWGDYDFHDFGIVGEPYLSIDNRVVPYFSDTGRRWDSRYSVKDFGSGGFQKIRGTNGLINLLKNDGGLGQGVCLTVHPNRWNDDLVPWSVELVFQNLKNIGKSGIIFYRNLKGNSAY